MVLVRLSYCKLRDWLWVIVCRCVKFTASCGLVCDGRYGDDVSCVVGTQCFDAGKGILFLVMMAFFIYLVGTLNFALWMVLCSKQSAFI